ncbi:hypothetical protein D7U98_06080 [Stenotrophomonas maltophilia]|nr:hypothetical protein [Stenotrophomonas maltophilia]
MRPVSPGQGQSRLRVPLMMLVAWVAISVVALWLLLQLPAVRTGDGSEYYAMELAISQSHRPYLTEADWAAYESLSQSGGIASMVPTEILKQSFPALARDGEWDFNHFWMYPLLASLAAAPVRLIGYGVSHNASFLMLHATMFSALLLLAFRLYGVRGVAAILILTFASPILWFANKVHTEFFTYCLGCAAVMLTARRQTAWASVCLALASSQNISLAAPAGVLLISHFLMKWRESSVTQAVRGMLVPSAMAGTLVLLHPLYYLVRHGAITPQLIAGGASTASAGLMKGFVFLLDPDIGLLPNWPLGVALLIAFILSRPARAAYRQSLTLTLVISYLAFNLYAQSATENFNAGATIDVARYGLWYLCLFLPGILALISMALNAKHHVALPAALLSVLAVYISYNFSVFSPRKYEDTATPTRASRFVQGNLPWAYDPIPEVFFERYSTRGESHTPFSSVVVGADCRKLLITRKDKDKLQVLGRDRCGMSDSAIVAFADQALPPGATGQTYMQLSPQQIEDANEPLVYGNYTVSEVEGIFLSGWAASESWGRWSNASTARLKIKLPSDAAGHELTLRLGAFVNSQHPSLRLGVRVNGEAVGAYQFDESTPVRSIMLAVPQGASTLIVRFDIESPASPKELGLSDDVRQLGVSLQALELR